MTPAIRFGRFELHPTERQLLVDGAAAHLGARAFDVLVCLVEAPGRLLTKSELLDRAWHGLVVEENNLQVQISALRKLLGEQAIATIPGRGYRFALPVDSAPGLAAPAAAPAPLGLPVAPAALGALIGRDNSLAAIEAALDAHRLLTVVGPGGVGKTRIAQEVAARRRHRHTHGVGWIDLAPLSASDDLAAALVAALGVARESQPALTTLTAVLRPLDLLLVLDNAEHLQAPLARLLAALLAAAPTLHLLVTSQVPLHIDGEALHRVPSLAVPAPGCPAAEALRWPAVACFVQRVQAADRRFVLNDDNCAQAIDICQHLDGLPLALQLAAARVPALGVAGVARALGDRFALLVGTEADRPARQLSLHALLDWTYRLLPADQQRLLRRLAVFEGGFTLELARAVDAADTQGPWVTADGLAALADWSLVQVDTQDPPRYALSESVRAFARERLADDDAAGAAQRHAAALRALFAAAAADFTRLPDAQWLARYEPELGNLRAALRWSLGNDPATALALVGTAAPLWHYLSLERELRAALDATEPLLERHAVPAAIAAPWWRAAQWGHAGSAPARARAAARRAHRLYRQLDDPHGLYAQLTGSVGVLDLTASAAALTEAAALPESERSPRESAWAWRARADLALAARRYGESLDARRVEIHFRELAGDQRGVARAAARMAETAVEAGQPAGALTICEQLLPSLQDWRFASTRARVRLTQAEAWFDAGAYDQARAAAAEVWRLAREFALEPPTLDLLAALCAQDGRGEAAAQLDALARVQYAQAGHLPSAARERRRNVVLTALRERLTPAAAARWSALGADLPLDAVAAVAAL